MLSNMTDDTVFGLDFPQFEFPRFEEFDTTGLLFDVDELLDFRFNDYIS